MFPFTFSTLLYPNSLHILLDTNISLHLYDTVIPLTPYVYCLTEMIPFTFTTLLYH